ncbi:MAG: hypothetical protein LAT50_22190, partial [Ectothiorhodospiraceae bacterium]|nr:hypothetical protein [Ectothiorhodospiraceae bacterium]
AFHPCPACRPDRWQSPAAITPLRLAPARCRDASVPDYAGVCRRVLRYLESTGATPLELFSVQRSNYPIEHDIMRPEHPRERSQPATTFAPAA